MQILERKKEEVEAKAEKMSDFLKMEYLENCLKHNIDIAAQRYCCMELSKVYEKRIMYPQAIKYLSNLEGLGIGDREKISIYLKQAELMIKAGLYEQVNYPYKKAASIINEGERHELRRRIIGFYKAQAETLEKTRKIAAALKLYERLVHLVTDAEQIEVKKKMLESYNKLGKVREYVELKKELERLPQL
ncbi:MAG: hypothetical protein WC438_00410 [Candidatus Pacearchaeota archaeon]